MVLFGPAPLIAGALPTVEPAGSAASHAMPFVAGSKATSRSVACTKASPFALTTGPVGWRSTTLEATQDVADVFVRPTATFDARCSAFPPHCHQSQPPAMTTSTTTSASARIRPRTTPPPRDRRDPGSHQGGSPARRQRTQELRGESCEIDEELAKRGPLARRVSR